MTDCPFSHYHSDFRPSRMPCDTFLLTKSIPFSFSSIARLSYFPIISARSIIKQHWLCDSKHCVPGNYLKVSF